MQKVILVTGANGHLGNNLVRALAANGKRVRAGVRDIESRQPFNGVDCERVYADLMDRQSLVRALDGVDTLYQVAAVYKHWARNPQKEIVQTNIDGTRNILEIAAQQKIKKIIYVSSITALDRRQLQMNETGWNQDSQNPYYYSKTESEKLAFSLAGQHNLNMVSVLPAAMVGPHCHGHLTPTMEILDNILSGRNRFDVQFNINIVAIKDVVDGMMAAAEKGRAGQRYILGHDQPVNTATMFEIAASLSDSVSVPHKCPKPFLLILARLLVMASRINGREPALTPYMVNSYFRDSHTLDLRTSRADLGYQPHDPEQAIEAAMRNLLEKSLEKSRSIGDDQ